MLKAPGKRLKGALTLLLVLLVGAGLILVLMGRKPEEPVYQGKPLSYWIGLVPAPMEGSRRQALKALGPEAAAYLIEKTRQTPDDTVLRRHYRSAFPKIPSRLQEYLPVPSLPHEAELRRISDYLAIVAPESPDIILAACSDPDRDVRFVAAYALPFIIPAPQQAPLALGPLLQDSDPAIRGEVAAALARLRGVDKTPALPFLLEALERRSETTPDAFLSLLTLVLGEIGPEAAESIPIITGLLESASPSLRLHSANALWKIASMTNGLPCIIKDIEAAKPDSPFLRQLLASLEQMGTAAAPATPVLEEKLSLLTNVASSASTRTIERQLIRTLLQITPEAPLPGPQEPGRQH